MALWKKKGDAGETDEVRPADPAPPPSAPAKKALSAQAGYGIAQAIDLMRTLPVATNIELVVQVIKKTLESANVRVAVIIDDATRNQESINARMQTLRGEISSLEMEIAKRTNEIDRLETSLAEITRVKDQLALAERLTSDSSKAEPARQSANAKPPAGQSAAVKPAEGEAPAPRSEGKPDRPRSVPPRSG
jgi:hypothetical protein